MAKNPRRKEARKKRRKKISTTSGPGYVRLRNPFEGLTREEMREAVKEMGQFHEARFKNAMTRLDDIAGSVDIFYVLTNLAAANLFVGVSDAGTLSPSWAEPPVPQSGIELFQVLALKNAARNQGKVVPLTAALQEIYELLPQASESFAFKRIASADTACGTEMKWILMLQESLRLHTQQVRNWGYYRQSLEILKKLYGPLDAVFQRAGTLTASEVISAFEFLVEKAETAVSEHMRRLRPVRAEKALDKAVYTYHEAFESPEADSEDFLSYCKEKKYGLNEARLILSMHSFLYLQQAFTITVDDLSSKLGRDVETVRRTLERLSISPGELDGQDVESFFLSNPVWTRPLIRLDNEVFFCPVPLLFTGFAFAILDGLCASNNTTQQAIKKRRARFLEDLVTELLGNAFPDSQVFRNVKWKDGDIEYETDLLVVIDSYLIIVEAKSGK
jgi:hypothetical protein